MNAFEELDILAQHFNKFCIVSKRCIDKRLSCSSCIGKDGNAECKFYCYFFRDIKNNCIRIEYRNWDAAKLKDEEELYLAITYPNLYRIYKKG